MQVRERHPVGPQHTRVAPGQRHVAQVGRPAERLVAGHQDLTAPGSAVVAVAGAVEGDADDALVRAQTVLRHHGRDVRVVVLHRADRPAGGVGAGPLAGVVAGVPVGHQTGRPHTGETLQVLLGPGQGANGGQIVHVADVLAEPGVAALGQGEGVLQVGAHGERRRDVERQRERQRCVPARSAEREFGAGHVPADGVVARHVDPPVVPQPRVDQRLQYGQRRLVVGDDRLARQIR